MKSHAFMSAGAFQGSPILTSIMRPAEIEWYRLLTLFIAWGVSEGFAKCKWTVLSWCCICHQANFAVSRCGASQIFAFALSESSSSMVLHQSSSIIGFAPRRTGPSPASLRIHGGLLFRLQFAWPDATEHNCFPFAKTTSIVEGRTAIQTEQLEPTKFYSLAP